MGGYVPNPVPIAAVKAVVYSAFGWVVRSRSSRLRNPVAFGVIRVAAGWLVGAPFVLLLSGASAWSTPKLYLALLLPRLAVWAAVIHWWFRPKGGGPALAAWSLLGVLLSTVLDLIAFQIFEDVPWLRIGIC